MNRLLQWKLRPGRMIGHDAYFWSYYVDQSYVIRIKLGDTDCRSSFHVYVVQTLLDYRQGHCFAFTSMSCAMVGT